MPDGEWSLGELGRRQEKLEGQYAQDHNDFRATVGQTIDDLREEVRWTRRLLIVAIGAAVLGQIVSSVVGTRPPA